MNKSSQAYQLLTLSLGKNSRETQEKATPRIGKSSSLQNAHSMQTEPRLVPYDLENLQAKETATVLPPNGLETSQSGESTLASDHPNNPQSALVTSNSSTIIPQVSDALDSVVVNPSKCLPLAADVIESCDGPLQKEINDSPTDESILNISLTDLVPVDFTYFEASGETVAPMVDNTISGEVREDFVTDVRTNDQMEVPTFYELTNRRGEDLVTEDRTDDQMASTMIDDEMTIRVIEEACT